VNATIVAKDWGTPIGLRIAVEHPEYVARIALLNTGLLWAISG
jgi:pimeloyl-ACP methyl ester carboxylesterase